MPLSMSVFSKNNFFISGISTLLSPEMIKEFYYIIDANSVDFSKINKEIKGTKKIVAFIDNDIEYYALKNLGDVMIFDNRSKIKNVISGLVTNDEYCFYKLKYKISKREEEFIFNLLNGLNALDIIRLMGINEKTFYVHRRNLMLKLQVKNRNEFYSIINRVRINK